MSDAKTFFEQTLPGKFSADPSKAEGMAGAWEFNVEGDGGGIWTVAVVEGKLSVSAAAQADAGCKIFVASEDWVGILNKEIDPTTAFMTGKLRIEGDMSMAMKLQPLLGDL